MIFILRLVFKARQVDSKNGHAGSAFRKDKPAALLDDAVDGGESQPAALRLGGKERLKDGAEHFRGDAMAFIFHFKPDVICLRHEDMVKLSDFFGGYIFNAHDEFAAFGHGIAGVDGEVDDDLLELSWIGANFPDGLADVEGELDLRTEQPGDEVANISGAGGEIERHGSQSLPPRESEQLTHEVGAAFGVFADFFDFFELSCGHEVARTDDRGEQVVKIMSDAAGKLSDGLHFLRLS